MNKLAQQDRTRAAGAGDSPGQRVLQRKSAGGRQALVPPPEVLEVLRSSGQPLEASTRNDMEQRFGQDFSAVRTHTDDRAAASARSVGALAYTVGRDVVFGAGQYRPESEDGRALVAHELTHVLQQSPGTGPRGAGSGQEAEADRAADAVRRGEPVPAVRTGAGVAIQRKVEMRDVGKGEQSGYGRLDELVVRLNAMSAGLVFAVSGGDKKKELSYTLKPDGVPDEFDKQMMGFIDDSAVIPMRLTDQHGRLGDKATGFKSPVIGDAWQSGYADIDDMLASSDLGLQFLLVHFLAERSATKRYDKRIGDLGGAAAAFQKAHGAGIAAELALLRDFFGDPTIRLLSDVPSFPKGKAIGRTHINSRGDKIRLRVGIGGKEPGLNPLTIDVLTRAGKLLTAEEYKAILAAAAAPAAPAAAAPAAVVAPSPAAPAAAPRPVDLQYHPQLDMPDPHRLPPDFWKPLPPLPKGSGPKSVVDVLAEKLIDPVIDKAAAGLSKDWRDRIKQGARSAVKSGVAKGARAAAEAAGVSDKATLDAIEKAAEAAVQQQGGARP